MMNFTSFEVFGKKKTLPQLCYARDSPHLGLGLDLVSWVGVGVGSASRDCNDLDWPVLQGCIEVRCMASILWLQGAGLKGTACPPSPATSLAHNL